MVAGAAGAVIDSGRPERLLRRPDGQEQGSTHPGCSPDPDERSAVHGVRHSLHEAVVSGSEKAVAQGDLVVVPAGKKHNFLNTGQNPLILYTVYGPPEHADGAVHETKEEADRLEEEGKDEPPSS